MAVNGIYGSYGLYGSYGAYKTSSVTPPKMSVSEDGLFEPISDKVSGALSDEYIEQIKAQARADAAKGRYEDGYDSTPRTGFAAMRDAQMKQYVSPDRGKATSQMSAILSSSDRVWKPGENLLELLSIRCTAKVYPGILYGTTSEIYNEDGEMIAGYRDSCGWFDVPTKDESRFQYESNQIYYEAYQAAKAELSGSGQQKAAPAESSGTTGGFDVRV